MIRANEIAPTPRDGLTTQLAEMHKMARAGVMGNAGPGLLHRQTRMGMTVQVDPMHALRQAFGKGQSRGQSRWA